MSEQLKVKTMQEFMAEGKQPEILFWVGSAGSFDDRAKKISRAFVKLLNKANVDFAVLGTEESSTGDVAKRAGNEFLFQMQAMMNIELLNGYEIKRIVTCDPHSFNTLKNEFPRTNFFGCRKSPACEPVIPSWPFLQDPMLCWTFSTLIPWMA